MPLPCANAACVRAGREGELSAISQRCVQLVREQRGGVVLVEGDPGMGKTRLIEELQRRYVCVGGGGMTRRAGWLAG